MHHRERISNRMSTIKAISMSTRCPITEIILCHGYINQHAAQTARHRNVPARMFCSPTHYRVCHRRRRGGKLSRPLSRFATSARARRSQTESRSNLSAMASLIHVLATTNPSTPSRTSRPLFAVVITGSPAASASIKTVAIPSDKDGNKNTSSVIRNAC